MHPTRRLAMLALAVLLLAGCSQRGVLDSSPSSGAASPGSPGDTVTDGGGGASGTPASYAVAAPGKLDGRLYRGDLLVTGKTSLAPEMIDAVRGVKGVARVMPLGVASASVNGRTLVIGAVDPAAFRRFAPAVTAQTGFVWDRLAGGEVVVDDDVSKRLVGAKDMLQLGTTDDAPSVHVGAFGPLPDGFQAVVNVPRGEQLGMRTDNALLVSTGEYTPSHLLKAIRSALGKGLTVQTLALEFDIGATRTAVLTGDSVSAAVGSFTYTNRANGEITPQASWVRQYIRTEEVPILGQVTCNKAVLPQMRAAFTEIVTAGLADKIHVNEYAGCYYPRYIGRSAANGLSLHSWGIAFDLNVPGNMRGTVGEMDRQVVAIFKRWGFAWGGDWNYTDPMHFEMNAVVRPG